MRTYTLLVKVHNEWIVAASGLLHGEVLEESLAFDRFRILEEI